MRKFAGGFLNFFLHSHCTRNRILNTKEPELPGKKYRRNLQKEVLDALFTTPERLEESPTRTAKARPVRKSRAAGRTVVEPLKDVEEYEIDDLFSKQVNEDGKHSVPYLISL